MPVLTAGFGLSRITPLPGAYLAGYAVRTARSESVHDELCVRALALDDGNCALAMVGVDVLALDSTFIERARAEISASTGIALGAVLIAATHTHGGPVSAAMFSSDDKIDAEYMDRLRAGIVQAVTTAWQSRFRSRIGVGAARAEGIGGNRHRLDGATDPELGVLKVTDLGGKTRAICLNYACHPTVLGPDNLRITADFPGFAVTRVAERLGKGAFAMFLNGAAGNISVGRSPEATALGLAQPGRTFERAEKIGQSLADLAVDTIPSIETSDECTLGFATRSVELPLRPLPPPEETEAALRRANERLEERRRAGKNSAEIQKVQLEALYAGLKHFEACRRVPGEQETQVEMQCFRIGGTTFLGMPIEPFVEIGLELKKAARGRLFIIELANGYMGYLPASGVSEEDGYETRSSRFVDGSDRILVQQALELERELFERERERRNPS
jgi:neutral ceramidase